MCEFECSTKDEVHTNCIMMLETSTSHPHEIELDSCHFKGIMLLKSIVGFSSSAMLLADSVYCEVMKITGCTFEDCQSSWGHLIEVIATSFELDNNSFDYGSATQTTPMTISVTSGQSSFQNTLFAASSDVTLMELTCGENAEIQFYNCCFTRQGEVPAPQTHYLTLTVQGSVKFSTVCFYGSDQSTAISVIAGHDKVSYEGNPDSYFGECSCWGNVDPEPEPTSVVTDPDEPSSSSSSQESESTPSEPAESTTTEVTSATENPDEGSGGGGKSNAGMIAGVVIAVLIIIAVIVVVILLLLRRRNGNNQQSDDAISGQEELAEETVHTSTEGHTPGFGEWSQTSEDNALFTTETYADESPFTNAFEEHQLFGE